MSGPGSAAHTTRLSLPPWAIAALIAAAGSLVYATHLYLYHRLQDEPASFPEELAEAAVHFGAWAALVPLVLRLARKWDLFDRRWLSRLLLHLGLGLGVALAQLFLHALLDQVLIHGWQDTGIFLVGARRFFARTYYANVIVYLALVLGYSAVAWARRRRGREAELERHLTQAQLDALRQQLQPHFLFNALNAVSTLIADDPPAAQRMIARLAELLRLALDERNAAEVPLWRELELAHSYLAIEQVRFGDRLAINVDVPPDARQAMVPGLLLQPLLENAVRHGLARRRGPGSIEVVARVEDTALSLRVVDRGTAPRDDAGSSDGGGGIGLGNVRARLRHLYGDAQRLEFVPTADGTAVELHLPLRFARPTPPEAALAAYTR
jgi:two-component system LytT family sensor kinase